MFGAAPPPSSSYGQARQSWSHSRETSSQPWRRPYSPSSPTQEQEEEVQEVVQEEGGLPGRIYEASGTIVVYQSMLAAGVLEVRGGEGRRAYCFFLSNQLLGFLNRSPEVGDQLLLHARLVTPGSRVPYLASCLWREEGPPPGPGALQALLQPAPTLLLEKYFALSEDLAFKLPGFGRSMEGRAQNPDVIEVDMEPAQSRGSREGFGKQGGVVDEQDSWGTSGRVEKYLSPTMGLITIQGNNQRRLKSVVFHVNQVWLQQSFGWSPYLETQSLKRLKTDLPEGQEVSVITRRIEGGDVEHQAVAVWAGGAPPDSYKTPSLLQELALALKDFLLQTTGDQDHQKNPLAGAPSHALPGRVTEHLSLETGLVRIKGHGVALFHLDQVWSRRSGGPLPPSLARPLDELLPVGTKVLLAVRLLPVHPGSELRYQATALWPGEGEVKEVPLPKEYLSLLKPKEERVKLVAKLDSLHSRVKELLRLDFPCPLLEQGSVLCVLPSLPEGWAARVARCFDSDSGLIRVTTAEGVEVGCLFHLEEVWDEQGLSALKSGVSMRDLEGRRVELVARSLGPQEQGVAGVLHLARRGAPGLQACAVLLLSRDEQGSMERGPQPTVIRTGQVLDCSGPMAFLLDPSLGPRLCLKLSSWLSSAPPASCSLLPRPAASLLLQHLQEVQGLARRLDSNNVQKSVYGDLDLKSVGEVERKGLPETLEGVVCRVVLLEKGVLKSEGGLAEVEVLQGQSDAKEVLRMFQGDGAISSPKSLKVLVLFSHQDYHFFTTPDYFASNLANVVPVSSTDRSGFCLVFLYVTGLTKSHIYSCLLVRQMCLFVRLN